MDPVNLGSPNSQASAGKRGQILFLALRPPSPLVTPEADTCKKQDLTPSSV